MARSKGWTITQILNTHEHPDHTGGNSGLIDATRARLLAHAGAATRIGGVDRGLSKGDVIRVGRTVELECLDTPGHTLSHICLLSHTEQPALFSGDTLVQCRRRKLSQRRQRGRCCTRASARSSRDCRTTRGYSPDTNIIAATWNSRSIASQTIRDAQALLAEVKSRNGGAAPVTTLGAGEAGQYVLSPEQPHA